MHFTRLRLAGFKSFVDPIEIVIEPGITGIVGPNGCGKSNVVEALRWVMGETSAKKMRGGEMDDVIFGGTSNRPARNIADVVLYLDNSDRRAPAQFNDSDEIEVSRRIERGAGSTYRINGREVRARDVQLLFADLASGAHSTAMVSQGRVGLLINAKPTERRLLLEEAAGITGLHSRRHEAELRLRAAEANLERLDDVIGALEGQYQGLQRQARQAARYRRMSEELRKFEAIQLHLRWREDTELREQVREQLRAAETDVQTRTAGAAEAAARQADAAARLPNLRNSEAAAAAELQRLIVARGELESEENRVRQALDEAEQQLQQVAADVDREQALAADARAALEHLHQDRETLASSAAAEAAHKTEAEHALNAARNALETRAADLDSHTERVAAAEARRRELERQIGELDQRLGQLRRRSDDVAAQRAAAALELAREKELIAADVEVRDAEGAVEAARRDLEAAGQARSDAASTEAKVRAAHQEADARRAGLVAEERALVDVLDTGNADLFPPLIDALEVSAGYEAALGAALGEELTAPIDIAAEVHWAYLPPIEIPPPLPAAARPLSQFVKGPDVLARRLALTGVVDDAVSGDDLAASLRPGQRLVTTDGALWRWDGYTMRAGAPTATAKRLRQRNRLAEVRKQLTEAEAEVTTAGRRLMEVKAAAEKMVEVERIARGAIDKAFSRLNAARQTHATLSSSLAGVRSRITSLADTAAQLGADVAAAEAAHAAATADLAGLDDLIEARNALQVMRIEVAELRAVEADRRGAFDRVVREGQERARRIAEIDAEIQSWTQRVDGATERLGHLQGRHEAVERRKAQLIGRPAEIDEQRRRLFDAIETAETARTTAADRLTQGESALTEADRALRAAETALAEAREHRIRCEAHLEQAEARCRAIADLIRERLDCAPDGVLPAVGIAEGGSLPERQAVDDTIERLTRQRDAMGPVNLRAEAELAELEQQITTMKAEREDLLAAIARLRQGISSLNREGRERLLAAFETVNTHFQELFVRLYGGGRAHLSLTDSEDPLQAGLEIMASPPGKKLQVMSLLSGGEQALTALSLLFAVFLTNPAPICVLDEVDAPLDDANVDRFCSLLEEIAHGGQTRFLCITHHRMTMARMDRLFGVTMGERGVSQLVSVDLRHAEQLRQTA